MTLVQRLLGIGWAALALTLGAARAEEGSAEAEHALTGEALFKKSDASVVAVEQAGASGSGFIISADGYILTNGHVVQGTDPEDPRIPSKRVSVTLWNNKQYPAKVLGFNLDPDCALLKIEPEEPLTPIEIGDSAAVKTGARVYAFGQPTRLKRTLTEGIISHVDRTDLGTFLPILQTDAAINPGNSGGPLLNERGQALGINTYAGGGQNLGFTVPINPVMVVQEHYRKYGHFRRADVPRIGVREIHEELAKALGVSKGILISSVGAASEAERVGFAPGDIIVEMDGEGVSASTEAELLWFNWKFVTQEVGKVVGFKLLRRHPDGTTESQQVTAVMREDEPAPRQGHQIGEIPQTFYTDLGLGVQQVVQAARIAYRLPADPGVLVSAVQPSTPAQRAGLAGGDIIATVEGEPTPDPAKFEAQLMSHLQARRKAIRLTVKRKKNTFQTAIAPFYILAGKRIALLAPDQDAEWTDFLQRNLVTAGAEVIPATPGGKGGRKISELKAQDLDALLLAGGAGGLAFLNDGTVQSLIQEAVKGRKVLGAVGPSALSMVHADPSLLEKKMTTSDEQSTQAVSLQANYTGKPVETDGKLVTTTGIDKDVVRSFLAQFKAALR